MYTSQNLRVKWGSSISEPFSCKNGVKQGGVLSPLLFCLYMDILLCRLANLSVGCRIGNQFCGALCYADDVTLLSPSKYGINILIKECEKFANEYQVKFNPSKCVYMQYNCTLGVNSVIINGTVVNKSSSSVHLGHMIGKNCEKENITRGVATLFRNSNVLLARFKFCSSFVLAKLFNSYCTSFYGSVLWRLESPFMSRFYIAWRKIIRRIWKLSPRAHSFLLPLLMNCKSLDQQILHRFKNFYHSCEISQNSITKSCSNSLIFSHTPAASNLRVLMSAAPIPEASEEAVQRASALKELCAVRDGALAMDSFNLLDVHAFILLICTE